MDRETIKRTLRGVVRFMANPRFLLCIGLAWFITNGWSYVMLAVGVYFQIEWMIAVSAAYLAFLWLPVSPEKIVTLLIAMTLLRLLFPNDQQTLGVLKELHTRWKARHRKRTNEKMPKRTEIEKGRCNHDNE